MTMLRTAIIFTALVVSGLVHAQDLSVSDRVAIIRAMSSQIADAKKLPPAPKAIPATVENAWLNEIKSLENHCLKRFGKTVWLSPYLPDDTANAERSAEGEEGVPAGQVKNYRIFKHRAEFVEDRLQLIALQECK